ncbi:hypothetical protein V8C44DRAFT_116728 [Trichoderma aethiopicum]
MDQGFSAKLEKGAWPDSSGEAEPVLETASIVQATSRWTASPVIRQLHAECEARVAPGRPAISLSLLFASCWSRRCSPAKHAHLPPRAARAGIVQLTGSSPTPVETCSTRERTMFPTLTALDRGTDRLVDLLPWRLQALQIA